jgi:hypothetical protein
MLFLAAVVLFAFVVGGFAGSCLGAWLAGGASSTGQVTSVPQESSAEHK